MMVGCEAASDNPWWCRVHESRIRFRANPPKGGVNDCDAFRDALDLAEEAQERVLADLRAKVSAQWVFGYDPDQVERIVGEAVLTLIEEAERG
jgi:hypothetical protein